MKLYDYVPLMYSDSCWFAKVRLLLISQFVVQSLVHHYENDYFFFVFKAFVEACITSLSVWALIAFCIITIAAEAFPNIIVIIVHFMRMVMPNSLLILVS